MLFRFIFIIKHILGMDNKILVKSVRPQGTETGRQTCQTTLSNNEIRSILTSRYKKLTKLTYSKPFRVNTYFFGFDNFFVDFVTQRHSALHNGRNTRNPLHQRNHRHNDDTVERHTGHQQRGSRRHTTTTEREEVAATDTRICRHGSRCTEYSQEGTQEQ